MNIEPASANPPRRRLRWYQFSLAAILIAVTVLCAFLAYWSRPRLPPPQVLLSDTDQQWQVALLKPTVCEFNETPLRDVVKYLTDVHGINIEVNGKKLEEANITLDTPVTKVLKNVSLKSALRLILSDLGLAYIVRDEVLLITSQDEADAYLVTRVYPVHDLLEGSTDESLLHVIMLELEARGETLPLADAKQATGAPAVPPPLADAKPASHAPAVPPPAAAFYRKLLVVRGSYGHHERVQDLLDRLRLSLGATTSSAAQIQTGPKKPARVEEKT